MRPINEYVDELIESKRYEILEESKFRNIEEMRQRAKEVAGKNNDELIRIAKELKQIIEDSQYDPDNKLAKELEDHIKEYNNCSDKIKKKKIILIILSIITSASVGYIISKKIVDRKKKIKENPKIILTNEYVSKKVKENKTTSIENILAFQYKKFDIVDLTGSLKNKNEKLILLYKDDPDYFIVYRVSDKRTYYIELDYENGGTIEETGEEFVTFYSNKIAIPEEGLKLSSNGTLV